MTEHRIATLDRLSAAVVLPAGDARRALVCVLAGALDTPGVHTRTYDGIGAHVADPALLAVDGPRGTWLITRGRLDREWLVWRSDTGAVAYRSDDVRLAWQRAVRLADHRPQETP